MITPHHWIRCIHDTQRPRNPARSPKPDTLICGTAALDITLSDGSSIQVPALPLEIGGRRLGLRHDLPLTGEHGTEVLAEIGYDAAAIGQLISNGVIRVTARD